MPAAAQLAEQDIHFSEDKADDDSKRDRNDRNH
jgi:hypothetical protein